MERIFYFLAGVNIFCVSQHCFLQLYARLLGVMYKICVFRSNLFDLCELQVVVSYLLCSNTFHQILLFIFYNIVHTFFFVLSRMIDIFHSQFEIRQLSFLLLLCQYLELLPIEFHGVLFFRSICCNTFQIKVLILINQKWLFKQHVHSPLPIWF